MPMRVRNANDSLPVKIAVMRFSSMHAGKGCRDGCKVWSLTMFPGKAHCAMAELLEKHRKLSQPIVITIRNDRIRISAGSVPH